MGFASDPAAGASSAASGQQQLVKRYAGLVRVTHWLNAVFLAGMIASGLQIYLAYAHFGCGTDRCPFRTRSMADRYPRGLALAGGSPAA